MKQKSMWDHFGKVFAEEVHMSYDEFIEKINALGDYRKDILLIHLFNGYPDRMKQCERIIKNIIIK